MKKIITAVLLLTFIMTAFASCMDQPGTVTDNTAAAGTKDTDAETVTVPDTDEITDETSETETEAETSAEETPADTSSEGKTDPPAGLGGFDEFDDAFMAFIEKTENGNYMISPLSFKYALGMAMAGADV